MWQAIPHDGTINRETAVSVIYVVPSERDWKHFWLTLARHVAHSRPVRIWDFVSDSIIIIIIIIIKHF